MIYNQRVDVLGTSRHRIILFWSINSTEAAILSGMLRPGILMRPAASSDLWWCSGRLQDPQMTFLRQWNILYLQWAELLCNPVRQKMLMQQRCKLLLASLKLARGNIVRMGLRHRAAPLPLSYSSSPTALSALSARLKQPHWNDFTYTYMTAVTLVTTKRHSPLKEQLFRNCFCHLCLAPKNVYFNCFI